MKLGEVAISDVKIDLNSRDEIPKILLGLQHIHSTPEIRKKVFDILQKDISGKIDIKKGRPGMDVWSILVLAAIRTGAECNYDQLREIANNHKNVREILGHGFMDYDYKYGLQTLKDNVSLLGPEMSLKIDQIVAECGHKELGLNAEDELHCQADSSVAKTDVCYPTDINLLLVAVIKVITLVAKECATTGVLGWRKSKSNIDQLRKAFYGVQNMKRSTSKKADIIAKRDELIKEAYRNYINLAKAFIDKALKSNLSLSGQEGSNIASLLIMDVFIVHANRQIDQIERRIFKGEKIPHAEKVFSLFEDHTEWISKGKAGVPQELGLRVSIVKDQHGFILYHYVMEKQTDDQVTVLLVEEAKKRFANIASCSFDKGYYTPDNKKELATILPRVYLPKKGKLSKEEKEIEHSKEFKEARKKHSSVESSIHALQHGGFGFCPDHGIEGFKRYIALSVLSRNIQTLGTIIQKKRLKSVKKLSEQQSKAA